MHLGKLTAVGAVTAGLSLIAAPATALTITYGGSNPITATLNGTSVFWVGGQQLACTGSSMTATVHPGTSNPAADITAASWSGCTFDSSAFGPLPATITASSPNWHLNAVSGMTNATNDHAVSTTITNITSLAMTVQTPLGTCEFDVPGSVNAVFDEDNGNGDQELTPITLGSTMAASNVSGFACLGVVDEADAVGWASAYITSTAAGAINIKP